ncbi:MAG: glucose-6-phosphate isomerase [Bacteroidales bacterium]|nr:MAG: glucose-6-phosphate isomerase [Bacteroidales bacterium]
MKNLELSIDNVFKFVSKDSIFDLKDKVINIIKSLHDKTGRGNDFLGWVNHPSLISEEEISKIEKISSEIKNNNIEFFVVIGIGGSYLGTKAVYDALSDNFIQLKKDHGHPKLLFAGHNIGEDYLSELLDILDNKKYALAVISKSGTTLEPAIGFRILRKHLIKQAGEAKAKDLIIAITDPVKGILRAMVGKTISNSFEIPPDIGGRYSVFTNVGLVPLAVAGFDIRTFIKGAKDMQKQTGPDIPFEENPAAIYAATRYSLNKTHKKIEILANFENRLHYLAEWWKQLYAESEGKVGKGIYPTSVDFTTDLHSMGQYIQEGERSIFETIISVKKTKRKMVIPEEETDEDKLNYLAGKRIDEVNKMAEKGTIKAHVDGGVPNIHIELPELNEYYLGQLMYFFEIACGTSGYLLEINPFNQPGVEEYKKNMFALLGKP